MMDKIIAKADVLLEALPYIQQFHGSVILVKFGGSAMENPEVRNSVLRDIAFMCAAGMRPIIVHGGGKAINAELQARGIAPKFINGLRYTDGQTIDVVDKVLHQVNSELVAFLAGQCGTPVSGVSGKDILRGRRIEGADPATGAPVDLGQVGEVINVDTRQLQWVLDRGQLPVIAPLAVNMDGTVFNVNADMAACVIAAQMKVRKLVFLSDVPGVLSDPRDETTLISTIHAGELEPLIAEGVVSGGMIPKLRSAVQGLNAGIGKVHLVDGRLRHALLLEIFTDHGIGTQIVP